MIDFLQDIPPGTPPLVARNLEKVDIPHLKTDIRKFNEAGVFSEEDIEWWMSFFDSFMLTYGQVSDQAPPWPDDGFTTALAPLSLPVVCQNPGFA